LLSFGKAILMNAECADPAAGRMGWISANGTMCAIVGNNRCQIFRTDTFQKQAETGIQPGMRFSDINSDGSLFASGAWHSGGVRVWNTRTGGLVKKLLTQDESRNVAAIVAFSPDGRHLVIAIDHEYCFFEVSSWALERRIPQEPENGFLPRMAFSRDGKLFAGTISRNKVRLHDAATGSVLADLEAPNSGMITGLAFIRDGTQLAACEATDALRVWDLRLIRQQLTELGLDWDQPPYPPAERGPSIEVENAAVRTTGPVPAVPH
jgi:hypothetical protein